VVALVIQDPLSVRLRVALTPVSAPVRVVALSERCARCKCRAAQTARVPFERGGVGDPGTSSVALSLPVKVPVSVIDFTDCICCACQRLRRCHLLSPASARPPVVQT
jgi:hypothetical protein